MARFILEKDTLVGGSKVVSTTGRLSSKYSEASYEVQDSILVAQANIVANEQRKNAGTMLNERGYGTGTTRSAIRVTSPFSREGSRGIKIAFFGTRRGGKTRNAEVAFFNEYGIGDGAGGQRMSRRNFIARANEDKADECAEIAASIFADYVASQLE